MRNRNRGVTLVELMIVVVIVAILAAVAYPSYRDHVAKAKRTEAKSALLQIATNQERHYLDNNTYTQNLGSLGFPVANDYLTESGSYIVRVTAADAGGFRAEAVYQGGSSREAARCQVFSIDGSGERTSSPENDCWTSTR